MPKMPQRPIGLRLDDDLLRRVDEARGDVPRARYIARALELALSDGLRPVAQGQRSAPSGSPSPSLARFR